MINVQIALNYSLWRVVERMLASNAAACRAAAALRLTTDGEREAFLTEASLCEEWLGLFRNAQLPELLDQREPRVHVDRVGVDADMWSIEFGPDDDGVYVLTHPITGESRRVRFAIPDPARERIRNHDRKDT